MKTTLFLLFVLRGVNLSAQTIDIPKVHPLNWYVVRLNPFLQILIYGKNISASKVSLMSDEGVALQIVPTTKNLKLEKSVGGNPCGFADRFSFFNQA